MGIGEFRLLGLQLTQHLAAVAVANPTQFGQENAVVALIELDLFGVGVAETVTTVLALEAWAIGTLGEEVFVGFFQIFQGVLQSL